ncbi:MAG: flagellar protein [Bacillota bacterium]
MGIRNCKRCGKIFHYDGVHKICNNCRMKEEEDFEKVKEYLRENPKSSINTVSDETGVEKKTIIEFIKNDRLIAEDLEIDVTVKCQRCGKEIKHGKYCESCVTEMKDEIESLTKKGEKELKKRKTGHNMHVTDRFSDN